MNGILEIEQKLKLDQYWQLKDSTGQLVSSARVVLTQTNTSADQAGNQLLEAQKKFLEVVTNFIVACGEKSRETAKALNANKFSDYYIKKSGLSLSLY